MKKIFLMTAMAIAMTFTACSSSEDGVEVDNPKTPVLAQKVPVGFNAYANRGVTRSGVAGNLDLTALEAPAGVDPADGGGFGVFAYYTDLKKYDQTYVPNFMYNQGVFKNGGNWEYTPVMYWPNESGADAQSDDEDKVSFFAYAPYVKHTSAASGSVADATYGITGFSRNTTVGDPLVKYIASFDPAKSVDLCWGVCAGTSWAKFQGSANQTMQEGLPWLDVEHPQGVDQKMTFTFKHALSQLNVQIDADADIATHDETSEVAAGTKVYVRSISFTGIAMKGALNLNNPVANTARWLDYSGTTDLPYGESVTVKDGRRDGREGATGAEANNELPAGLNPQVVQNSTATTGVTKNLQNLFAAAELTTPVYVIPTGEAMTVTIVYDVETASPDLTTYLSDGVTHGSSIENRISKTITWSSGTGLQSGKKYTLQLHLGMNSVQFDADVAPWDDSTVDGSGWLPSNTVTNAMNVQNNPLWRVAEFNMKSNGVMHTSHGLSGEHLNVWNFADAQNINLTGYHLPTMKEQASIFPMDKTTSSGTNILELNGTLAAPTSFSEIASTVNGTDVAASTSYIGKFAFKDYYAVRFVGTAYASAWHYKFVTSPCAGLLIESYLVSASNETEAKTILAGLASSTTFTGEYGASAANQRPTDTAVKTNGFCQRFLPACGYKNGGSGTADSNIGSDGSYRSSTADPDSDNENYSFSFIWSFGYDRLKEGIGPNSYCYSVRLFHD